MNGARLFLNRHSSTILTVASVAGVVTTSVLFVKATPKALHLIQKAETEKGEPLSAVEKIKTAWRPYVPATIAGVSTIACILGVNCLNTKSQASLMSAYALLDNTYREYCKTNEEINGEESSINIRHEIIKAKINNIELDGVKTLFFDIQSMRFFESSMENVMNAIHEFLENLDNRGYACLNEFYDVLGIPRTDYGYQLGWFMVENNDPYNCHELDFTTERVMINDTTECHIITPSVPAALDYIL